MAVDVQFANTDYSSFLVGDYFFDDDNNNCSSYLVEDDPLDQYYLHFDEQQQLLFKEEAIAESSYDLQLQTELESLIYLDPPANLDNAMTTSAATYHHYPNFSLDHEVVPRYDQLFLANSHVDSTVLSQLLDIESLQPPAVAPSFERCDLGTTPPIWYDSIPSSVNFASANKRKRFSTLEPCTNYTFIDPNSYRYNNHHHQFLQDDYANHHLNFHRGLPVSNCISGGGGVDHLSSGYLSNNNYMNSTILSSSLMNSELNGLQFAPGVTTIITATSTVNGKKEESLNITGGGACAEHDEQVKSSTTAQSRAARERRRKIAHKMQELGKLLPDGGKSVGGGCGFGGGGVGKMNTAEMLQAAFKYVKFLQAQVSVLEAVNSSPPSSFQKSGDARDNNLWILWSDAVQEKLYRSEKCLIPTELVNQLASDENLSEKDPVTASNLKQLLMTTK